MSGRPIKRTLRGSLRPNSTNIFDTGSIPACAGEPTLHARHVGHPGVYPRVCGGAVKLDPNREYPEGLSPRVRGSLCQIFDKGAALFSI